MPSTDVIFYAEDDGASPVLQWIEEQPRKVQDKLTFVIDLLTKEGYQLRRPHADILRDKVYELRVRHRQVNYRLLYFFYGNVAAVVAHGCTKEGSVDDADINRAVTRRELFLRDPEAHTYCEAE